MFAVGASGESAVIEGIAEEELSEDEETESERRAEEELPEELGLPEELRETETVDELGAALDSSPDDGSSEEPDEPPQATSARRKAGTAAKRIFPKLMAVSRLFPKANFRAG